MSNKKIKDYSYPKAGDENLQSNLYERREFYFHKVPRREKFEKYEDIQEYRNSVCKKGPFQPREQQALLPNFLSPDTPYKGVLLVHGVGSGKTATAIQVAEQFKDQAKKYNTKIYILTFGPASKETWKSDLLFATRDTYLKDQDLMYQLPKNEKERQRRVAVNMALQNYTILSYMTFYKKVLGEKITDKKIVGDDNIKSTYRRNEEGEIERELVVDRITDMDNSLIIVDEAHNLTGNEYGLALKKIIEKSKNLRVILLSATPMKNLADDIIELINFLRPKNDPILREKVFTSEKNYLMGFKPGGEDYLQKMANGYISYYRGKIPYTFAKQVDKGEVIDGLLFTHVVQCFMEPFQLKTYQKTVEEFDDALDRKSSSAANFVYPGLDKNKKDIIGYYSNNGITKVLNQLEDNKSNLIKQINLQLFKNKISKDELNNFLSEGENRDIIGTIYKLEYLKNFSIKFYKCIKRLNRLVEGDKGNGIGFIYSNLTKAGGIEVFAECLRQNGYLEYQENPNEYQIQENTKDAITGLTFNEFNKKFKNKRQFKPATFLLVTGSSDELGNDDSQEEKQRIIREVYNNSNNIDGSNLKFVLGSKVMNEGITLENVKEIHILDVHYNLGKVEQVIGRGIRMCKHINSITETNKYPQVNVYRYVVSLKNGMSTDEILYQKGEKKYLLVKRVERLLKEVAIDCPLLLHSNMFPEELEKYKNCVAPTMENKRKGLKLCPELCDFEDCEFKCKDPKLNKKYWNDKKKTYDNLEKNEINYGTFNKKLATTEIQQLKDKIKNLFRFKNIYSYEEILKKITDTLSKHQKDLFEENLLNLALEDLMPETENDFNNFKDTIVNKFNISGYLIQRNSYYIFQPFDEKENISMFERDNLDIDLENPATIQTYLEKNFSDKLKEKTTQVKSKQEKKTKGYDFESIMEYYDDRDEYDIVGIIDKNPLSSSKEDRDNFKIRPKKPKTTSFKRAIGIPSLKGAVCSTKDKKYLLKVISKLPEIDQTIFDKSKFKTKEFLCDIIYKRLLFMEKYGTSKNGDKMTYLMVPSNHPELLFPLNLEDRLKYIIDTLQKNTSTRIEHKVKKLDNGIYLNKRNKKLIKYELTFKNSSSFEKERKFIERYGGKLSGKEWKIIVE